MLKEISKKENKINDLNKKGSEYSYECIGFFPSKIYMLEPKILLDAAGLPIAVEPFDESAVEIDNIHIEDKIETNLITSTENPATFGATKAISSQIKDNQQSQNTVSNDNINSLNSFDILSVDTLVSNNDPDELLFIDKSIENYQELMSEVKSNQHVFLIDGSQDGIKQISEVIGNFKDIKAVHLISHGSDGELQLGNSILDNDSIKNDYSKEFEVIKASLSKDADILIYGCNFTESEVGKAAANSLAKITGADVAASDDLTGFSMEENTNSDWEFEYTIGNVTTQIAFDVENSDFNWEGTLNVQVITPQSSPESPIQVNNQQDYSFGNDFAVDENGNRRYEMTVSLPEDSGSLSVNQDVGNPPFTVSGNNSNEIVINAKKDSLNALLNTLTYHPTGTQQAGESIELTYEIFTATKSGDPVSSNFEDSSGTLYLETLDSSNGNDEASNQYTVEEDTTGTFVVSENSSVEKNTISNLTITNNPSYGSASISDNSSISYTPDAEYDGQDQLSISYKALESGLNYEFFDGKDAYKDGNSYSVDNFRDNQNPDFTGIADDFEVNNLAKELTNSGDTYGIKYSGYIYIADDGNYTFSTTSDDGSKMYVNDQSVVQNDGLHGARTKDGTIFLEEGYHSIEILFFEHTGRDNLTVTYQGPDTSGIKTDLFKSGSIGNKIIEIDDNIDITVTPNQEIVIQEDGSKSLELGEQITELTIESEPLNASTQIVNNNEIIITPNKDFSGKDQLVYSYIEKEAGLKYEFYDGKDSYKDGNNYSVDNFKENSNPDFTGLADNFEVNNLAKDLTNDGDTYAIKYTGFIYIESDGNYTFSTTSDDGSKMYVNDNAVVENDGLHGARTREGTIFLASGYHEIEILFFEHTGRDNLSVTYQGVDTSQVKTNLFDSNNLYHSVEKVTKGIDIIVEPVNDSPVSLNDNAETNEDTPIIINVLANDSDLDGDNIIIANVDKPENGSIIINNDNTITYTPNDNFHGQDSFSYTITDGKGESSTSFVNVQIFSINDNPVAENDSVVINQDTSVSIDVISNDSDVEQDQISITSFTQGNHGSVELAPDGTIKYTPAEGFSGVDSFTYTIIDEKFGINTATVTVIVSPTAGEISILQILPIIENSNEKNLVKDFSKDRNYLNSQADYKFQYQEKNSPDTTSEFYVNAHLNNDIILPINSFEINDNSFSEKTIIPTSKEFYNYDFRSEQEKNNNYNNSIDTQIFDVKLSGQNKIVDSQIYNLNNSISIIYMSLYNNNFVDKNFSYDFYKLSPASIYAISDLNAVIRDINDDSLDELIQIFFKTK